MYKHPEGEVIKTMGVQKTATSTTLDSENMSSIVDENKELKETVAKVCFLK